MRLNPYFAAFVLVLALLVSSCQPTVRKRPIGYSRLGPVSQFSAAETFLPAQSLLVRRDSGGLSVMSTMCTYDLSILSRRKSPQGIIWVSQFNPSEYDAAGRVLHGPAIADLPFFEIVVDAGSYGEPQDIPKDTLYVKEGIEKPREWRFKLPESEPPQAEQPAAQ